MTASEQGGSNHAVLLGRDQLMILSASLYIVAIQPCKADHYSSHLRLIDLSSSSFVLLDKENVALQVTFHNVKNITSPSRLNGEETTRFLALVNSLLEPAVCQISQRR
jgi:hypothetical protein